MATASSRAFHLAQRRPDADGAVDDDFEVDLRIDFRVQFPELGLHSIDHLDDVGAGFLHDVHRDGRAAVEVAVGAHVLGGTILHVAHGGDVAQADDRTVALGNNQIAVLPGFPGIVVGVELIAQAIRFDRALRRIRIGIRDRRAHVLQADSISAQCQRIDLHPHRRQRTAVHVDGPDTLDLRETLRHERIGGVIDLALRQHIRRHGEDQHRKLRAVELAVRGVACERGRQVGTCRDDRRLNVACGTVDVTVDPEGELDARRAHAAR